MDKQSPAYRLLEEFERDRELKNQAFALLSDISDWLDEAGQGYMGERPSGSWSLHRRIYELLWPDLVKALFTKIPAGKEE